MPRGQQKEIEWAAPSADVSAISGEIARREFIASLDLNERQIRFCEEYVKDFNFSRAMLAAGWVLKNAQEKYRKRSELAGNPRIRAYVDLLKQDIVQRVDLRVDEIMDQMKAIAMFDPADVWDVRRSPDTTTEGGGVVPGQQIFAIRSLDELSPRVRQCIKEIKVTTDKGGTQTMTIKFYDKQQALERLYEMAKEQEERKSKLPVGKNVDNDKLRSALQDNNVRHAVEVLSLRVFEMKLHLDPVAARLARKIEANHGVLEGRSVESDGNGGDGEGPRYDFDIS